MAAGILKALGFDSKPDYAERIPETLTPEDFSVHSTFHHGFPSQPTCLAYDPVQQLLAIGTETGAVLLLGKPGLERYFKHQQTAVLQMIFITNKGLLITLCDNKNLYLWSLKEKQPTKVHCLEFEKEEPTTMAWAYRSEWMYVGTDAGNVHIVQVDKFMISGYCIHWNHCIEISQRTKPGGVTAIQEHPMDQGKVLLAFSHGLCVIWNVRSKCADKRFNFDPGDNHILTSVCWLGNGKVFACSYSNGSIVIWNPKTENKPEKVFFPHESDPSDFKPICKLQLMHTDSDPWFIFTGGFPEKISSSPQTLTVMHSQSTTLLSSNTTIIDFLTLPSSPFIADAQKPFALAILAKNELIVHDLQTPGYPSFQIPYALDVHMPPVTCVQYYGNCPEELVASLHSVKSKIVHENKSTKMWPLKGGKWGDESPLVGGFTDLLLTGHTDGSVRLWFCSSVIFQPFFTVDTAQYFKMRYSAASLSSEQGPTKRKEHSPRPPHPPNERPPHPPHLPNERPPRPPHLPNERPPRPPHPPNRSPASARKQDSDVRAPVENGPPDILTTPLEPIQEEGLKKATRKMSRQEKARMKAEERNRKDSKVESLPSSPTLLSPDSVFNGVGDSTDSVMTRSEGASGVERRQVFSREKKSIFTRRKVSSGEHRDGKSSPTPSAEEDGASLAVSGKEHKEKKIKMSFRKIARVIKYGQQISDGKQSKHHKDETDSPRPTVLPMKETQPDQHPEPTSEPQDSAQGSNRLLSQDSSSKSPPQERSSLTGRSSPKIPPAQDRSSLTSPPTHGRSSLTSPPTHGRSSPISPPTHGRSSPKTPPTQGRLSPKSQPTHGRSSPKSSPPQVYFSMPENGDNQPPGNDSDSSWEVIGDLPPARKSPRGSRKSPAEKRKVTPSVESTIQNEEDFFPVHKMNMCVCGQWLCVTNLGGNVLAFDFQLDERVSSPQSLMVNFDKDSVIKLDKKTRMPSPNTPGWTFVERLKEALPGFHLKQHCQCFYSCSDGEPLQLPAIVSAMLYSIDMGLLAIGTDKGLALIDTMNNSCLYTLSYLTSILYMADPSKFSRQVKKETSSTSIAPKHTFQRHSTSWKFEGLESKTFSPTSRVQSAPVFPRIKTPTEAKTFGVGVMAINEIKGENGTPCQEVEENDSCVICLELVQLLLDSKQTLPTLTLWVGTASGNVVAYGVNTLQTGGGERSRGASKPQRKIELLPTSLILDNKSPIVNIHFLNAWGDKQVVPYKPSTSQGSPRPTKSPSSQKPQNYAIIIDETKIRSFSFPGMVPVAKCTPPIDNSVILKSEYFSCNDLPCLLTLTSCKHILVHSLPGLKQLILVPYAPLGDTRVMHSFRVSGDGQALYMASSSEIQRICITKTDRFNLPNCLPDIYVRLEDPHPASRGIMGTLFGSVPSEMDREELFGESAGRPWVRLAKRDGKIGTSYTRIHRETLRGTGGVGDQRGTGGVGNQLNRNRQALDQRGKDLSELEKKTMQFADDAADFGSMATKLAEKYR